MKKSRFFLVVFLTAVFLSAVPLAGTRALHLSGCALADGEGWKKEYSDVCSKTQDAMSFSPDELRGYLERCDKLKARMDELDGSEKKVYAKRLQMCRDLFSFTLDSKEKK